LCQIVADLRRTAPFLAILVLWLVIIFASFSLFSALNVTDVARARSKSSSVPKNHDAASAKRDRQVKTPQFF
jgi:hypothetical protein